MTRPFKTATPERAIKPTAAEMENGISRSHRETMPPVSASGTPVKTRSAYFSRIQGAIEEEENQQEAARDHES